MLKNFLYLTRCVNEVKKTLVNRPLLQIFSQEKNKIIFDISNKAYDEFLIVSLDPQIPYLQIKKGVRRARKNSLDFFTSFTPTIINDIEIAVNDRVVRIATDMCNFYILFRRGSSQIFAQNKNNFESFYSISPAKVTELKEEIDSINFKPFEINQFEYDENLKADDINKYFRFFSKNFRYELLSRIIDVESSIHISLINDLFQNVLNNEIAVGKISANTPLACPSNFQRVSELTEVKLFNNYNEALNYYLILKFKDSSLNSIKDTLNKYLKKELSFYSNKLNKLKNRIDKGSNDQKYQDYGNMILMHVSDITKGSKILEINDQNTDKTHRIKIDPKITAYQNAEKYFDKSRDERKSFEISRNLYNNSLEIYNKLLDYDTIVNKSNDLTKLREIAKELKINTDTNKIKMKNNSPSIKYRHYIIEEKFHVYVGRDSKSNDLLTTKFAKQNDLWFHARGVSGSHTLLRNNNPKEIFPKNIIKLTASIAAFYSKAKTAGSVPVAYTFAKYVYKKKGMAPGKVIMNKEDVVIVRPEISEKFSLVED